MEDIQRFYCKECGLTYKTDFDNRKDDGSGLDHLPEDERHVEYNYCPRCASHNQVKVSMLEKLHEQDKLEDVHPNVQFHLVGLEKAGEM
jgi:hypothetical protein